jgi:myosin heavy subunit
LELAVFKLLLTGVDDSSIEPVEKSRTENLSRTAKAEVIDELIQEHKDHLSELVGEEDDPAVLNDQLAKLDENLTREREALRETEQVYQQIIQRRSQLRRDADAVESRKTEIEELFARFQLLDQHYSSDLERLEGVREAGSLLAALSPQMCPLCGASPDAQDHQGDCDGNIDIVVTAANAESGKIELLRQELRETVNQLRGEARRFDRLTPRLDEELKRIEEKLEVINPSVSEQRAAYSDVFEKRSTMQHALNLLTTIEDLNARKAAIEAAPPKREEKDAASTDLSASTLDSFSTMLENVLQRWNFPDASRVYFDRESRDFVISGKPRGSRGKGMRAITYAAFTTTLLEYTRLNERAHPGFIILDTPLLAYREPEGEEDDLSGTDVQDRFYEYLEALQDRQVIVFENNDPPDSVKGRSQTSFFCKNPRQGRYGFFPVS